MAFENKPACKQLVLDAGPLLSLSPLRGLAETFVTVPQVLEELQDKRAREHFERLGQLSGVKIEVKEADAASLAHAAAISVIQTAKKTGDYSVLSYADLCVIALTYALDVRDKAEKLKSQPEPQTQSEEATNKSQSSSDSIEQNNDVPTAQTEEQEATATTISDSKENHDTEIVSEDASENESESGSDSEQVDESEVPPDVEVQEGEDQEQEPLDVTLEPIVDPEDQPSDPQLSTKEVPPSTASQQTPLFEDPSDSDDGEGEWITPDNVAYHKSRALDLVPSASNSDPFQVVTRKSKKRNNRGPNNHGAQQQGPKEQIGAGCMTADFAMQNLLLHMDLSLVGMEGTRIKKVKTWVLRCHACFKICKDASKKFCPSCGNPTLLRTSVTIASPTATDSTPAMEIHLKKNFQYRNRGTIYSIPSPKPGSSKRGTGEGLILREDQAEYIRAVKAVEGKRAREEKRMVQNALQDAKHGGISGVRVGNWMDPDWMPDLMSIGASGKGRTSDSRVPVGKDGLPIIGYGRKNPNERRRKK